MVIINAEHTAYIAYDVLELIEDFAKIYAKENNIRVILKGFKADYDSHVDQHSNIKVEHHKRI